MIDRELTAAETTAREAAWLAWIGGKPEFDTPPRRAHDAFMMAFNAALDYVDRRVEQVGENER